MIYLFEALWYSFCIIFELCLPIVVAIVAFYLFFMLIGVIKRKAKKNEKANNEKEKQK